TEPHVTAVGTQIMPPAYGPFTARIEGLDTANNVLAAFTFARVSNAAADDSALFIGIRRDQPFAPPRFSVGSAPPGPASFAINRVDVTHGPVIVPEPGALMLAGLGAGLLSCGLGSRWRRCSAPR